MVRKQLTLRVYSSWKRGGLREMVRLCDPWGRFTGRIASSRFPNFSQVGSQLVEPKAVAERNFDRIRDLARQYAAIVSAFRKS